MSVPVSIVIPMYNAEEHIVSVIEAILAQDYDGEVEIIVVNDGSRDRSPELVSRFEKQKKLILTNQENRGAVTATNTGFSVARHEIICSIDSDVVLERDWLNKIASEFNDPTVGAVQGYYKTPARVSFIARMMGYDIEKRYDDIQGKYVSQVCTGDTAYRRSALEIAGPFDPTFAYGYDNDMSYRLQNVGYKLVFRKDAICYHHWKSTLKGYIVQQYRSAYGRLQLVSKHRNRISGDSVSGLRMILQVPLALLMILCFIVGLLAFPFGKHVYAFDAALFLSGIMLFDRFLFAFAVATKQKDLSALLLPFVHLLRNTVWGWAFLRWNMKHLKNLSG
jgi:cellulose synthase/poly-beta-1,6-N-acetylglucosamine synthase-like glycosyltransferase